MKKALITLLLIILVNIASGCSQGEDDKIKLLFFSSGLPSVDEKITSIVAEGVKDSEEEDFQLEIYPMSIDKISIELAAGNGDIYFIEQDSAKYMVDPVGFIPLDEIGESQSFSIIEEYKGVHPETGELHVYAVPIENGSLLMKKLELELEKPLVAFVPKYSKHKQVSLELLKYLVIPKN